MQLIDKNPSHDDMLTRDADNDPVMPLTYAEREESFSEFIESRYAGETWLDRLGR